jgi:hypothetical protein
VDFLIAPLVNGDGFSVKRYFSKVAFLAYFSHNLLIFQRLALEAAQNWARLLKTAAD